MFIVLEGIDGSGKSTQIKNLEHLLTHEGVDIELTCEPTTREYGKLIRQIFNAEIEANPHTVAALFLADRLEHILHQKNGLLQMLEQGKTILCDRYYLSSIAYQSVDTEIDWVMSINEKPRQILRPDVTIYLDILPEKAMQRLQARDRSLEIYETTENLKLVHQNYAEAIQRLNPSEEIWIFGADKAPQELSAEIWHRLRPMINKKAN